MYLPAKSPRIIVVGWSVSMILLALLPATVSAQAQATTTSPTTTSCPNNWATIESFLTNDLRQHVSNTCSSNHQEQSKRKRALLIVVDGFRADAAAMLPLPNIRRLQHMGTYSYWAAVQSSGSAVSGPGFTSLLTGVEVDKHGVTSNFDMGSSRYPTVLHTLQRDGALHVGASVSWNPLLHNLIHTQFANVPNFALDASYAPGAYDDQGVATVTTDWILNRDDLDFIFAEFNDVDYAGHNLGSFDGYNAEYQSACARVDQYIGVLLDAIGTRSSHEEWMVVLTTDHGGQGSRHGATNDYNRRIPMMVASTDPRVHLGPAPIPGSHMDVLPTLHYFFGLELPLTELDGRVFGFSDYYHTLSAEALASAAWKSPIDDDRAPPAAWLDTGITETTCVSSPTTCGCPSRGQADYRGTLAQTENGRTCMDWTAQSPHAHVNGPNSKPNAGLEGNYCRNPDGEPRAWCYTTDPSTRWEFCNVPAC